MFFVEIINTIHATNKKWYRCTYFLTHKLYYEMKYLSNTANLTAEVNEEKEDRGGQSDPSLREFLLKRLESVPEYSRLLIK